MSDETLEVFGNKTTTLDWLRHKHPWLSTLLDGKDKRASELEKAIREARHNLWLILSLPWFKRHVGMIDFGDLLDIYKNLGLVIGDGTQQEGG